MARSAIGSSAAVTLILTFLAHAHALRHQRDLVLSDSSRQGANELLENLPAVKSTGGAHPSLASQLRLIHNHSLHLQHQRMRPADKSPDTSVGSGHRRIFWVSPLALFCRLVSFSFWGRQVMGPSRCHLPSRYYPYQSLLLTLCPTVCAQLRSKIAIVSNIARANFGHS